MAEVSTALNKGKHKAPANMISAAADSAANNTSNPQVPLIQEMIGNADAITENVTI